VLLEIGPHGFAHAPTADANTPIGSNRLAALVEVKMDGHSSSLGIRKGMKKSLFPDHCFQKA
jgi:hypothetical protein